MIIWQDSIRQPKKFLTFLKESSLKAYRHGLYNTTFSRKLANKEIIDINALVSRIKTFIQGDDYIRRKRELENSRMCKIQKGLSQGMLR